MIVYGDKADLAQKLVDFPLRYATGIYFGNLPPVNDLPVVNSGTASLISLNNKPVAITCSHVIDKYRHLKEESPEIIFQIGNLKLDPIPKIISESSKDNLDIVIIDLEGENLEELKFGNVENLDFFVPSKWPPGEVNIDQFVAFAGFPGAWRESVDSSSLVFNAFTCGACLVGSVTDDHLCCVIERQQWIVSYERAGFDGFELMKLGGLSGGPVFFLNELFWEFVGIIYEHNEAFDILYVRKSRFISDKLEILE